MDLSIIIVSWNVKELLKGLLESIFVYTKDIKFEVIVVDNSSKDGSAEMVKKNFSQVKLIENKKNFGYSKAYNQGLKIGKGKYLLSMNPDMELTENTFKKMVDFMNENPEIGLSTCQLLYEDKTLQPNVKDNPGLCDQAVILLKLHHFIKPKCLKNYLAKDFDYTKEAEVKQIMGAFTFAKKQVMEKLGYWCEDYFAWWEDIDLCYSAQKNKIIIGYTPISKVIHYEGKSFAQEMSYKKQKRFNKGMRIYFKKYKPFWQYLIIFILSPISLLLSLVVQLLKIKPRTQSKI